MPAPDVLAVFPSRLGWVAMIGSGRKLKHLTFGHASSRTAISALPREAVERARRGTWNQPLVRRLQAYALGSRDDFRDVAVELGSSTDFGRRVLRCCRRIRYGKTITYGELAAKAGFPGAARAVGQCMASNRVPLVIPCHRVVAANGGLGGYSALGGIGTKQRLLELEKRKQPSR